jgi:hypothetical protein
LPKDYKRVDEDVDVQVDEEVQPVEEMVVKIPVAAAMGGGEAPGEAAAALGGSGPLPLLLPWNWCCY